MFENLRDPVTQSGLPLSAGIPVRDMGGACREEQAQDHTGITAYGVVHENFVLINFCVIMKHRHSSFSSVPRPHSSRSHALRSFGILRI